MPAPKTICFVIAGGCFFLAAIGKPSESRIGLFPLGAFFLTIALAI